MRLVYSVLYCVSKSTFTSSTGLLQERLRDSGAATWRSAPDSASTAFRAFPSSLLHMAERGPRYESVSVPCLGSAPPWGLDASPWAQSYNAQRSFSSPKHQAT